MSTELVSQSTFEWIVTAITGGVAGAWLVYDAINLARLKTKGAKDDPVTGDKRFGYVMGMVIGAAGVWGCLRFHGVV